MTRITSPAQLTKITFEKLVSMVDERKDDPLNQVFVNECYECDGYIFRLSGGMIQWRTPVQNNFTWALPFSEFIEWTKSI